MAVYTAGILISVFDIHKAIYILTCTDGTEEYTELHVPDYLNEYIASYYCAHDDVAIPSGIHCEY